LSTVRTADRILVIDGGRIVEAGSHAELIERDGPYRHMVRLLEPSGT
jgi:subfamily B ATP-binding cassette protein MsbA